MIPNHYMMLESLSRKGEREIHIKDGKKEHKDVQNKYKQCSLSCFLQPSSISFQYRINFTSNPEILHEIKLFMVISNAE